MQILMTILKGLIIDKKNGTEIRKVIKIKYNNGNMNMKTIFKFMIYIREAIASYIKHIYQTEHISTLNGHESYSIDDIYLREKNNIKILSYLEKIFKYCYYSLSFNFCSEDDQLNIP